MSARKYFDDEAVRAKMDLIDPLFLFCMCVCVLLQFPDRLFPSLFLVFTLNHQEEEEEDDNYGRGHDDDEDDEDEDGACVCVGCEKEAWKIRAHATHATHATALSCSLARFQPFLFVFLFSLSPSRLVCCGRTFSLLQTRR